LNGSRCSASLDNSKRGPTVKDGKTTYAEPPGHSLRDRYVAVFGGADVPVPVEAIAEDLLGLYVEEAELDGGSGLLYPPQRRILLNARDGEARRRFTLANELGHWVCQCSDPAGAPEVFCRAEDVTLDPDAKAIEREANVFATALLMPEAAAAPPGTAMSIAVQTSSA
jgi:IrrE N-terminal-like domain